MMSIGWLWLYFGAFLMLLEFLAPGFVIFFFGLSAATVGCLRLWLGECFSATWQMVAFSAFSILYLIGLRRWLKNVFTGSRVDAEASVTGGYVGRTGKTVTDIDPPHAGRVLVGDAEWNAVSPVRIEAGADVKIVSQDNLTLGVEKI